MKIAVASDHGGFPLKAAVADVIRAGGHDVLDLGAFSAERSDYPDFAYAIGRALQTGQAERGVLLCGSGVGACIAANKMHGIRAGVCHDTYSAHQAVEHDDMNLLCLGARIIGSELAVELVRAFLGAKFLGTSPYVERLEKVKAIETAEGQTLK